VVSHAQTGTVDLGLAPGKPAHLSQMNCQEKAPTGIPNRNPASPPRFEMPHRIMVPAAGKELMYQHVSASSARTRKSNFI
jgi:hypothetical protein